MKTHLPTPTAGAVLSVAVGVTVLFLGSGRSQQPIQGKDTRLTGPEQDALRMIKEGRQTFRFDTFGDEGFWGDALKLHHAILGKKLGGVGPGVSPKTALAVGLKV